MHIVIKTEKTSYESEVSLVQFNEMIPLICRMPGKYTISVDCDNDGSFVEPNRVISKNFPSTFKEIKPEVKVQTKAIEKLEKKEDKK